MKTDRRKFLGNIGLGAVSASFLGSKINTTKDDSIVHGDRISIMKPYGPGTVIPGVGKGGNPRDIKVNVKLIYYALIHQGIWEGPCRYRGGGVGPEKEMEGNRSRFKELVPEFKKNLSSDANMLEPVYYEFPEFHDITRHDLLELEGDKEDVDLYVVTGTNLAQYLASIIGDIYKKPVAHWRDTAAYLRSRGLEGYVAGDYGGMDKLIALLRARKAFQQTNILLITDLGIPGYPQTSAVRDFEDLNKRFGMGTTIIGFQELANERERIMNNHNSMTQVEKLTDKLINNARNVHIGKKEFIGDVLVYQSVKNLMKKNNCNAFSLECFEWCGSRQPDMWKAVPCLTHSLLRDEGYPSACEGDISALLALDVFMGLSKTSAFMGNMNYTAKNRKREWVTEQWVNGVDTEGEKLWVGHNVPALKMLGFEKPDLPYEIRNFIMANDDSLGWGGTIKVDFTKIKEKTVTIGRFDPLATKMLVTKGEVVGMRGFDNPGCCTGAIINVPDPKGYEKKSSDYGHHFALTYGDYTQELIDLADMLKIKIELHNI
jgi:L-fucose isomerase-like protein